MSAGIVTAVSEGEVLDVDAVALEEDTFLVLSADPNPRETHEPRDVLGREVSEMEPKPLGSVVVTDRDPIQFLAIVHDLSQEPTCREEWVEGALREIFREVASRRIRRLAMPMLGTVHGSLDAYRFVDILKEVLVDADTQGLDDVLLVVPDGTDRDVLDSLATLGPPRP